MENNCYKKCLSPKMQKLSFKATRKNTINKLNVKAFPIYTEKMFKEKIKYLSNKRIQFFSWAFWVSLSPQKRAVGWCGRC